MKTAWSIVSIVAVANLLALAALTGWLLATDRIDAQRLQQIRSLLAEPIGTAADAPPTGPAEPAEPADIAISAANLVRLKLEASEADRQRVLRAQREIDDLKRVLQAERDTLETERARFEAERDAFLAERDAIARIEGSAQFRRALAVYQGLKPDQARDSLQQLINAGQITQVVAYLSAMDERIRTRVVQAFVDQDPALAADLLERIRVYGTEPAAERRNAPGGATSPGSSTG